MIPGSETPSSKSRSAMQRPTPCNIKCNDWKRPQKRLQGTLRSGAPTLVVALWLLWRMQFLLLLHLAVEPHVTVVPIP